MKEPKYVLNILYNDRGVYLSERIQEDKEMCGLWQSPGGKVEEGETSEEAVLRETAEETDIELKLQDLTYLFNDPHFNCDVYMTKLQKNQIPQQTEPEKQGPWMRFAFKTYHQYAKNKKTTPTHTTYIVELMKLLKGESAMTTQQEEQAEDALFGEAEVYDTKVNRSLDTGAVGCIISKQSLDKIGKPIEAATNVKIIDVNGNRSSPLGIMRQVPIKIRGLETKADMVVTDSKEYNVLLGNTWLKHIKAVINYDTDQCLIEVDDETRRIPIICTRKINPNQFVQIDVQEELELESEEEDDSPTRYCTAQVDNNIFSVED